MCKFTFYDTDSAGQAEYDISGVEYDELLELCFRYSSTFSLVLDLKEPKVVLPLVSIEPYRIPVTENVKHAYAHYGVFEGDTHNGYEIRHYLLCDAVKKVVREVADSIYQWICGWGYTNPADPAFYRKDGSVFFHSVIHEGVCTLVTTDKENVDTVVQGGMWHLE